MNGSVLAATTSRILPPLDDVNRPFWTGGVDGVLLIQRCVGCRRWVHPPTGDGCPQCGDDLAYEAVSGKGTVFSFTVNHQQFHPDVVPPYVIAIVELDEQADLRLPTNLVDVDPDTLECGMPVQVCFERNGGLHLPVFAPDRR